AAADGKSSIRADPDPPGERQCRRAENDSPDQETDCFGQCAGKSAPHGGVHLPSETGEARHHGTSPESRAQGPEYSASTTRSLFNSAGNAPRGTFQSTG